MEENTDKKKASFKEYNYLQGEFFPSNLSEWIPEKHLVRIVDKIIESIDLTPIFETYKGGGCSSYHPKMMLKVIIYAYCEKIYSSRKIEKALCENINFMWISGKQRPDFRTINRFRLRLKNPLKKLFFRIVKFLIKNKYIDFKNYFFDGTKLEANANKYSYVWKKSAKRYKKLLLEKIDKLFENIDMLNTDDDLKKKIKDKIDNKEIDAKKLTELKSVIDESLKRKSDKDLSNSAKKIEKDYLPKLEKYEDQEQTLGDRNSFSKTDKDATFMRMKDDQLQNGQLKAAYNVQIGTENQFILNYSVHQKSGDTSLLIPHIEELKKDFDKVPENIITDAGYGSEENYEYLNKERINEYVKYNTFKIEDTKSFKNDRFKKENFKYDKEKNEYICPDNKRLKYVKTIIRKTDNGYETKIEVYECDDCTACPLKTECTKAEYKRGIQINYRLNELRLKAKKLLTSETGIELRKKRGVEVESVFGHIKWNRGFSRFMLRGIEKVSLEWGLLSIAHNFRKVWVLAFLICIIIFNKKNLKNNSLNK